MDRARSGNDKEAEKEYENYNSEEARLEMTIQHDYEIDNGKIEDTEEFKTAIATRDDGSLRPIIAEDNKKKEQYMKEFLREREEEETQKKKRQREQDELEASAASAAASGQRTELQQELQFNPANKINMEPPVRQALSPEPKKPTRPVPYQYHRL
eukprot:225811-Amphidinium_carterae.1